MCGIEQALPYVALAVLCPAAYEGILRQKFKQLAGASTAVARPHVDADADADAEVQDSEK